MNDFKVGDRVECISGYVEGETGMICTVTKIDDRNYIEGDNFLGNRSSERFKLASTKSKEEPKTMYMVYGTNYDNKSRLFKRRKDAEAEARKVIYDNNWTGDIIIYEMKPLSIAERSIKLRKIK